MFEVIDLLQSVLILWSFSTNFLITLHHVHMSFIYKFLDCLSYMFYWVHSIQKHLMDESVEHCIFLSSNRYGRKNSSETEKILSLEVS